jgi:drug/metabolite transporter (DMT)-like permease
MTNGILLALTAGVIYGILSLAYKFADIKKCRSAQFTFVLSLVAALVAFAKSFSETSLWNSPALWLLGGIMGGIIVAGIFVIMAANRLGPVYSSWTMVNVSFMFAILLSALILKEKLLCVDAPNLLLFGLALYFFVRGMKAGYGASKLATQSMKHVLMLLAVFVTNGLATFGSKLKYTFWGEANTSALPTVFYMISSGIAFILILRSGGKLQISRDEWKLGALGGVLISVGTILFLSAMTLPAAVVFTITQATSLTSGVALTTLVARERLNGWMVLGLMAGLLLLFAVVFREQTAQWLCG